MKLHAPLVALLNHKLHRVPIRFRGFALHTCQETAPRFVLRSIQRIGFGTHLKNNGIDPATDLEINQSIDFGSTAAAFSGGQADYTIEFEPSATALEAENSGYVVASLGVDSGYVPYTAYSAKTSYLNANPNIIQKFTNALQKGMDFVQSHTPEEIAKVIAPQFKETDLATITTIVSRYYEQDTWKSDLIFNEESFNLLQDILENSGELKERVPYEELVTTTFAKKAAH